MVAQLWMPKYQFMRQSINNRRRGVPFALWSEIFALWRDHARRPALPLLLAMLLFVSAPFTASANCSFEMGGHEHEASTSHSHNSAEMADDHHAHDAVTTDDHHAHDSKPQVTDAHGAILQAPATCCSCSSEPINATVAPLSAPHHPKADSHALVYAVVNALPVYRFDALEGLHTRAGPPTDKSPLLSLASLIGRAPPISL